jgi:hypothetical protein
VAGKLVSILLEADVVAALGAFFDDGDELRSDSRVESKDSAAGKSNLELGLGNDVWFDVDAVESDADDADDTDDADITTGVRVLPSTTSVLDRCSV